MKPTKTKMTELEEAESLLVQTLTYLDRAWPSNTKPLVDRICAFLNRHYINSKPNGKSNKEGRNNT